MNDIFMKDAYNGYKYKYNYEPIYLSEVKRKLLKKKLNKLKKYSFKLFIQ